MTKHVTDCKARWMMAAAVVDAVLLHLTSSDLLCSEGWLGVAGL
jgi:hypothetical protein